MTSSETIDLNLLNLDTPAVVVDLDIMDRNLKEMADLCRAHDIALRPHTKTHKTVELARQQLSLGATGITVAKLSEAEVMARAGISDMLVAYESIGPRKMQRLVSLLKENRETPLVLTVALDSLDGAVQLSDAGTQAGVYLPVLIEIDTGLNRTGVSTPAEALSLARHIRLFPGITLAGIMTHEGQVYRGGADDVEFTARRAAAMMREVAEAIRSLGLDCSVVSVGSTPGARWMVQEPGITELRPGTYIFNDRTQVKLGAAAPDQCALTVLSTVISTGPGRAIVDAGTKSLTSDAFSRFGDFGEVIGDPGVTLNACSEEHGHLDTSHSVRSYKTGDRLRIVPNHVCPVVNLADRIYGVRKGQIEAEWSVAARGCVQ